MKNSSIYIGLIKWCVNTITTIAPSKSETVRRTLLVGALSKLILDEQLSDKYIHRVDNLNDKQLKLLEDPSMSVVYQSVKQAVLDNSITSYGNKLHDSKTQNEQALYSAVGRSLVIDTVSDSIPDWIKYDKTKLQQDLWWFYETRLTKSA